jgi:FkbM family methyltransferase
MLNWTARVPRQEGAPIAVPLLGNLGGELLGELAGRSWKTGFFERLRSVNGNSDFVDVGANVGQTLVQYLAAGALTSRYTAFEPNPSCAGYLVRLAEANRLENVDVFPFALSSREECRGLELAREDDPSASIVKQLRAGRLLRRSQPVACFSLDFLRRQDVLSLRRGFVMKIDVEGSEADVIDGARRSIAELRPIVQCEVLWAHSQESIGLVREHNAALVATLSALDYRMFRLRLDVPTTRFSGLDEIDALPSGIYARGRNSHECEYLFLPGERADTLRSAFSV